MAISPGPPRSAARSSPRGGRPPACCSTRRGATRSASRRAEISAGAGHDPPGPCALALIGAPLLVFAALFLLPLANLAALSLRHFDRTTGAIGGLSLDNYGKFLGDPFYLGILWRTFKLAAIVTLFALVIGYPVAVYLSRATGRRRAYLTLVILAPCSSAWWCGASGGS
jgi:ABC-type spermidine/putrescine transport system permease subunit I